MKSTILIRSTPWPSAVVLGVVLAVAAIVLLGGIVLQPTQAWAGILVAGILGTSLALGAALFSALCVAAGGRWFMSFSDVPMDLARTLVIPLVPVAITLVVALQVLFPWAEPGAMEHSHLLHAKQAWLNAPFFWARAGIVMAIWLGLVQLLRRSFTAVAAGETTANRGSLVRNCVFFLLLFALTISVASWDWTMSLEPEWFSTMRGVYGFAGTFLGGIAAICVVALLGGGPGGRMLTSDQRHDLGKLLFAFSMFWAYIWFCEFMLIWYANVPEETPYFFTRLHEGWGFLFWLNPVMNFGLPFLILLSAHTKRNPAVLLQVALLVLMGRFLDTYLMVVPSTGASPSVPTYAMCATAAVLMTMCFVYFGRRAKARAA